MSKRNTSSLVVKLEGDSSISVNTLINMLTHYTVITERANEMMGEGAYKADVKVKALNEGSFEISFVVMTTWLQDLLTKENTAYAATIASGIVSIFYIYKYFKGKKVKLEEAKPIIKDSIIQCSDTIINIYNDRTVNEALRQSFETAKNDTDVKGVTLIADGIPSETVTEEEFADLVLPCDDVLPDERIITDETAILNIISLSFNKGDNWKFIYRGDKITTKLSDDGLQEAIDNGAAFAKGDALEVILQITQKWVQEYNTYINSRYKVVKVIRHFNSVKEQQLFK